MPLISGPLLPEGALVDVEVGWSHARAKRLRMALRPVPPPLPITAMVDSGAEISCADPSITQQLGLPFGGSALANVPAQTGLNISPMHDVSLVILHPSGDPKNHLGLAPNGFSGFGR